MTRKNDNFLKGRFSRIQIRTTIATIIFSVAVAGYVFNIIISQGSDIRATDTKILGLILFILAGLLILIKLNSGKDISKLNTFDVFAYCSKLYSNNKALFRLYFVVSILLFIFYGAKLFFQSYSPDDYARYFMKQDHEAHMTGRWLASILNTIFFAEEFHILPYFNTLFSLLLISLSGLITIKIWSLKNAFLQITILLMIGAYPAWSHNLWYNTNPTVAIGVFLSVFSVYLLFKNIRFFPVAILLMACGIGIYQTVLQIALIIVFGNMIFEFLKPAIINTKQLGAVIQKHLLILFLIVVGFQVSSWINEMIIDLYNLTMIGRYDILEDTSVTDIIENTFDIKRIFTPTVNYPFLNQKIKYLSYILTLTGLGAGIVSIWQSSLVRKLKLIKISLLTLSILTMIVILIIVKMLGLVDMPQNLFHVGWFLAVIFIISFNTNIVFRNISSLIVIMMLGIFALYISVFYDGATRQTQADLFRINQIVTSIRNHQDYPVGKKEINFLIVGQNAFPVKGWERQYEALSWSMSQYMSFIHFTDFKFEPPDNEHRIDLLDSLSKLEYLPEYPEKGSIQFIDSVAILILNKEALDPVNLEMTKRDLPNIRNLNN